VVVAAAAFAVREAIPNSRRVTARAAQASGAAAGLSPLPSPPNHAVVESTALTEPGSEAMRPAWDVATGGVAAAAGVAGTSRSAAEWSREPDEGRELADGSGREGSCGFTATSIESLVTAGDVRASRRLVSWAAEPAGVLLSLRGDVDSGDLPVGPSTGRLEGPVVCEFTLRGLEEPRAVDRVGLLVAVLDDGAESEPVDPAEPVVSARAAGAEAIAEPTPSATASAPTRPTKRA
jgi:hypothetical protein